MKTPRMRNVLAGLSAMVVTAGLAACGGGSGGADTATTAATGGQTIDVTATDFEFEGLPDTLEQGPITVNFANEGKEPHMMVVGKLNDGFTMEDAIKAEGQEGTATEVGVIPPVEPGADAAAPLEGEISGPGHYFMLCPLPTKDGKPHYELGQLYEFDIE